MGSGFENAGWQPRMVASWTPDGRGPRQHGVVMKADGDKLSVVALLAVQPDTKFYDEGGSDEQRDCDNVLMRSCPPPGGVRCGQSLAGKCYAFAKPSTMRDISLDDAGYIRLRLEDGGKKISEQDYTDIKDHLWRDELQKQKPVRKLSAFEQMMAKAAEIEAKAAEKSGDGFQYGG